MTNPTPSAPLPNPHPSSLSYASAPSTIDSEHLRILSICWYINAGITAFFGSFPLIHVAMGFFFVFASPSMTSSSGGPPPPAFLGWFFIIFGCTFVTLGWTVALLSFLAARSLAKRQRLTFIYIASALACLSIPLGTILGIFTFIVLGRPTVKSAFTTR